MEWKQMEQKWGEMQEQAKKRWDKLSDEDLKQIAGNKERLVGKIREKYSLSAQDAEKQVEQFKGSLLSGIKQ
ncbi:MAG TPA: CsbD family protein [Candidatus Krumholzibacteria bacterium]|nr:CsbD family protein [Candidatus Krumholzibacteria bacterium]